MNPVAPRFSIVIPTYNRADLIKETVESALSQDHTSFEVIVVDDGSTDTTPSVLGEFMQQIHCITTENRGAENARNTGIKAAIGEYIVFLDSDDILYANALSIYDTVIKKTDAHLLLAKAKHFNGTPSKNYSTEPVEYYLSKDYLAKKNSTWLGTSVVVVKRDDLMENSIFFKEGTFPVDDLDFILRAGTIPGCCIMKQPTTVGYREHPNNSIKDIALNIDKLKEILRLNKKGDYPGGRRRAFDRDALIGGHLQCWTRKGISNNLLTSSFLLLLKGHFSILAIILKKNITIIR